MAHALSPGSAQLGWYMDGLPDDISPPHQVMLRNENGRVTVTALVTHDSPLAKYFKGGISRRDDLDPPAPNVGYFIGAGGSVALAGGSYTIGTIGGAIEGRILFDYAVVGGSGLEYACINGLHTSIEHLGRWMDAFGPRSELVKNGEGRVVGVTAKAELSESIPLSDRLNLSIARGWREEPNGDSLTLGTPWTLSTGVEQSAPWWDHITIHRLVCDLLTISGDEPLGFTAIRANATHDLDGPEASVSVSRPVVTGRMPGPTGAKYPHFLFTFSDIGGEGVSRWIALNDSPFHGALDSLRGVFRPHETYLESKLGMAAIAVEKIGHELGVESGRWVRGRRQKENPTFKSRCQEVAAAIGDDIVTSTWAADLTNVNRALKHPEWPENDGDKLWECWLQTRRVLRAWVATRLGADSVVVRQRLGPWSAE